MICTSSEGQRFRFDGDLVELVSETPPDQESGEVWADLYSCTNLTDGKGTFEDGDVVARFGEAVGSREAAKTAADDDDVDGKRGTTPLKEQGRLRGREVAGHG